MFGYTGTHTFIYPTHTPIYMYMYICVYMYTHKVITLMAIMLHRDGPSPITKTKTLVHGCVHSVKLVCEHPQYEHIAT